MPVTKFGYFNELSFSNSYSYSSSSLNIRLLPFDISDDDSNDDNPIIEWLGRAFLTCENNDRSKHF